MLEKVLVINNNLQAPNILQDFISLVPIKVTLLQLLSPIFPMGAHSKSGLWRKKKNPSFLIWQPGSVISCRDFDERWGPIGGMYETGDCLLPPHPLLCEVSVKATQFSSDCLPILLKKMSTILKLLLHFTHWHIVKESFKFQFG
ncbi:hypothetical protein CEXT_634181 [Caerostris extrusa]|uniref:Uncharacterized protein n=1 Tax=Caerostris extrusa TaxID=172846 RepID=A0AAV4RJE5_CAEEX|nr:hypothetical protein CEXT_634181 [Caerostris extrusa]